LTKLLDGLTPLVFQTLLFHKVSIINYFGDVLLSPSLNPRINTYLLLVT